MINYIRNWCEGLVVAVVISIIIEMLLPEGDNKKYVKVVIGIYIIFVILNPICEVINLKINFKNILDFNSLGDFSSIETSSNIEEHSNDIRKVYLSGIENSIKEEITNLGYLVESVKIYTNNDYSNIEKTEIKIISKKINNDNNINKIDPIFIGKENEEINQYEDIKTYLSEKYFVKKEAIILK